MYILILFNLGYELAVVFLQQILINTVTNVLTMLVIALTNKYYHIAKNKQKILTIRFKLWTKI